MAENVRQPCHEKTCFLHMRKQRRRSAALFSLHSSIPLPLKSDIPSLEPSCEVVQPGLCRTWSETLKTGFLMKWFICPLKATSFSLTLIV